MPSRSRPISVSCSIVGVGEHPRSKASGKSTLTMAVTAARNALADAGIDAADVDAVLSYQDMDSCLSHNVAAAIGTTAETCWEQQGGGTCTETLVAHAVGLLSLGVARHVLIFRSLNGRSGMRFGQGVSLDERMSMIPGGPFVVPFGVVTPAQQFALVASRHMCETGLDESDLYAVCRAFYDHASRNPNAIIREPLSEEDYFSAPYLTSPFRLHDYCLETDEASAIVVTTADRASDLRSRPVMVEAVVPRRGVKTAFHYAMPDVCEVAGEHVAPTLFGSAGVRPDDIDVAGFYDCFSWVVLRQLEAFGFVERGESGSFARGGQLEIGGTLPSNTAGGQLAEGYTHGLNNFVEVVRQLRGDYAGTPRQVNGCRRGIVTGWGGPSLASGAILAAQEVAA